MALVHMDVVPHYMICLKQMEDITVIFIASKKPNMNTITRLAKIPVSFLMSKEMLPNKIISPTIPGCSVIGLALLQHLIL